MRAGPRREFNAGSQSHVDPGGVAALAVALGGCLVLAVEARHSTFTGDDWSFILQRRGFSADVFLRPHNEHLSALPVLAYKVLLAVFGAGSYVPFIALLLLLHGVACLLLYALARRYVGPWAALAPTCVLAVLGPAWQDLLWAFQIGYVGSVAAGLGMALCLEHRERRADVAAGVLLGASLLCSSIGLAMVVLGAILIALQRPHHWRRMFAVVVPVAGYLLWYAYYGVTTIRTSNIPRIPRYVFDALSAAVSSVTGFGQTHVSPFLVSLSYGRFLAIAAVCIFVLYLARGGRPPALTWAALGTALALWIAEALAYFPGGREAGQSRYQYPAAALVLLVAASAIDRRHLGIWSRATLAAATIAVCAANVAMLHQRTGFWSANAAYDRAELGSLELARAVVSADFAPENAITIALAGNHNLTVVTAGPYFSAVDAFGSPADRPNRLLTEPEVVREDADLVLAEAERIGPAPAQRTLHCQPASPGSEHTAASGSMTVGDSGGTPARLQLRRLASSYRFLAWKIAPGSAVTLHWAQDRSPVPWRVRVVGGTGLTLCVGR